MFASAHLPEGAQTRPTGILFCSPLALQEQMSHRVRRDWAEELAHHGYPALRFDLHGFGDSTDYLADVDALEMWIEAAGAAADWLRNEAGCTRVVALGISFGGLLAWASAARGASIDDLILWNTPTKGSRLLREIHASATVLIDPRRAHGHDETATKDSGLPAGAVLDDSGQVIHKRTAEAISGLDLTTLPLPEASSRRVLLFERPGDDRLHKHLEETGVELTVRPGEAYDEMMQYVQFSRLPADASGNVLAWLGDSSPTRAAAEPNEARPVPVTSDSIELIYNGTLIRETLVSVEVEGCTLRGVLTEPVTGADADLSGVFFSAGSDRRIGQNRLWVGAARRWAAMGTANVRLDPPGVGDSDGECEDNGTLRGRYYEAIVNRTVPILDGIASLGVPDRFMVAGVCSGGWRAVNTALIDDRIAGVYAVDFPFFRWNWWIVHLRGSWIDAREPRLDEAAPKRFALRMIKRAMRTMQPVRRVLIKSEIRSRRNLRALGRLRAQGTQLTCLFREASDQFEELGGDLMAAQTAARADIDDVTVHVAPGYDPQYRPIHIQTHLNTTLDDALMRVRARLAKTRSADAACEAGRAPAHAW